MVWIYSHRIWGRIFEGMVKRGGRDRFGPDVAQLPDEGDVARGVECPVDASPIVRLLGVRKEVQLRPR